MNPKPPALHASQRRLPVRRNAVTIGIGVLCSSKPRPHEPRPDGIIMVADTMGSTETDSTDALHKMYFDPDARMYASCAGNMELCAEIVSECRVDLMEVKTREHITIWEALCKGAHRHRAP